MCVCDLVNITVYTITSSAAGGDTLISHGEDALDTSDQPFVLGNVRLLLLLALAAQPHEATQGEKNGPFL